MYANPLHPGHLECLNMSKDIADQLWVIVNNDHQARLKRRTESFQDEAYRSAIIAGLKPVDRVILSIDTDSTVCETLRMLFLEASSMPEVTEIFFTKGGDRFANEIPERTICDSFRVKIIDGLGSKTHSSSNYVKQTLIISDTSKVSNT